jgi:hypothetical protein
MCANGDFQKKRYEHCVHTCSQARAPEAKKATASNPEDVKLDTSSIILSTKPKVSWNEVAGLESAKKVYASSHEG